MWVVAIPSPLYENMNTPVGRSFGARIVGPFLLYSLRNCPLIVYQKTPPVHINQGVIFPPISRDVRSRRTWMSCYTSPYVR